LYFWKKIVSHENSFPADLNLGRGPLPFCHFTTDRFTDFLENTLNNLIYHIKRQQWKKDYVRS